MNLKVIGTLFALGILAACSSVQTPDMASTAGEPQAYRLAGKSYTPTELKRLAEKHTLYYVATPEATAQGFVHVFRSQRAADGFKRHYRPSQRTLAPQLFESNTTIYDGTNYNEDKLKLIKGTVVNDLHALLQPDGESWGNQTSSLKAADGVWTDLYDFKNLDPNEWRWSTHGDNYKNLPSWVNNDASSLEVGQ